MAYIHNNGNTHNRRVSHELVMPTVKAEIFYVSQLETAYNMDNLDNLDHADQYTITVPGWYWWPKRFTPCNDANGPFASEAEAITDAQA